MGSQHTSLTEWKDCPVVAAALTGCLHRTYIVSHRQVKYSSPFSFIRFSLACWRAQGARMLVVIKWNVVLRALECSQSRLPAMNPYMRRALLRVFHVFPPSYLNSSDCFFLPALCRHVAILDPSTSFISLSPYVTLVVTFSFIPIFFVTRLYPDYRVQQIYRIIQIPGHYH
jgi:hypothetical protein